MRGREESGSGARVRAKIEVDISTVLVGHIADWVAVNRAEIVDGDFDALRLDGVAAEISVECELVARSASRARSLTRTGTELLLAESCSEAGLRVAAGVDGGGAIGRAIVITGAVFCEAGFHLGEGTQWGEEGEEEC